LEAHKARVENNHDVAQQSWLSIGCGSRGLAKGVMRKGDV